MRRKRDEEGGCDESVMRRVDAFLMCESVSRVDAT
jgi:hypothetical protein